MEVLSKIKVFLKFSIFGIDLYEIKADDQEEKLQRAFALARDNTEQAKSVSD